MSHYMQYSQYIIARLYLKLHPRCTWRGLFSALLAAFASRRRSQLAVPPPIKREVSWGFLFQKPERILYLVIEFLRCNLAKLDQKTEDDRCRSQPWSWSFVAHSASPLDIYRRDLSGVMLDLPEVEKQLCRHAVDPRETKTELHIKRLLELPTSWQMRPERSTFQDRTSLRHQNGHLPIPRRQPRRP